MSEEPGEFRPPLNRQVGPIASQEEADFVRHRLGLWIALERRELADLDEEILRDVSRLVAWEVSRD